MKNRRLIREKINKRFIPNIFTVLNMYLGFSAIILLINGNPIRAAWFVFFAAILDAFDGKLARMLGIESTFGTEFDSFADTISFCTTSAILIYTTWLNGVHPGIAIVISFLPILFGTIRLAKFNVDTPNKIFTGLTTPLYANILFGYVLFSNAIFGNWGDPRIGVLLVISMGLLMISRVEFGKIPYLSLKRGRINNIRLITIILLFISIILFDGITLFPVFTIYIVWNFISYIVKLEKFAFLTKLKPGRE